MYVRRVAKGSRRFTQGKAYKVISPDGKPIRIIDNRDEEASPCMTKPNGKTYWERVEGTPLSELNNHTHINTVDQHLGRIFRPGKGEVVNVIVKLPGTIENVNCRCSVTPTKLGANEMLKIKDVTLINGKNADDLEVSDLVYLIKEEEQKIENLFVIKSESKAITRIKEEHDSNVKKLITILDSRD